MKVFGREMRWMNEPQSANFMEGALEVTTGEKTDFWRDTFYNFWRDDGHFLYETMAGDFTAEVTVRGDYRILYDQAGLMVRLSETHWVKAGIEYTDGQMFLSVVVTNDTSDWSLMQVPDIAGGIRIRITRHHEAIRVQFHDATKDAWVPVRLAYLPPSKAIDVGIMCCSPEHAGFLAQFEDYTIGPPISRQLHD